MVDEIQALPETTASPILTSAHKIAIVGLGLIGGSLAQRLVQRGRYVVAWDHTKDQYEAASSKGINMVDTLEELVAGKPDILVLATPIIVIPEILNRLAPILPQTTTLTDVASVKSEIRAQVIAAGLEEQYVGGHPMTGNELSGFESSDPDLFADALWAVCVDDATPMNRFLTVADMITQGVGNRMVCIDDMTHDRSAALISHMPHVVATALASLLSNSADRQVATAMAAGCWRDMTRVSLTDPKRTEAMVIEDADNVSVLLHQLAVELNNVAENLQVISQRGQETIAGGEIAAFFASAQPFRNYKHSERFRSSSPEETILETLTVGEATWRQELAESARQGRQIVRFLTTHQVQMLPAVDW